MIQWRGERFVWHGLKQRSDADEPLFGLQGTLCEPTNKWTRTARPYRRAVAAVSDRPHGGMMISDSIRFIRFIHSIRFLRLIHSIHSSEWFMPASEYVILISNRKC